MRTKAKVSGSVVAGFPSPAEQYLGPPHDLNELLVIGKVTACIHRFAGKR